MRLTGGATYVVGGRVGMGVTHQVKIHGSGYFATCSLCSLQPRHWKKLLWHFTNTIMHLYEIKKNIKSNNFSAYVLCSVFCAPEILYLFVACIGKPSEGSDAAVTHLATLMIFGTEPATEIAKS